MRLITHNFLICNVAKCLATVEEDNAGISDDQKKMNFPLQIVASEGGIEQRDDDYNREYVMSLLKRIDWNAFRSGAADMGYQIPEICPEILSDEVLHEIHHTLVEIELVNGKLVCRHCGREYVVEMGIPNMLLREDEV